MFKENLTKGWVEPLFEMRSTKHVMTDLLKELEEVKSKKQQALVSMTSIQEAEKMKTALESEGFRCETLHRDKELSESKNIMTSFKQGNLDVIVGVNLLKDGVEKPAASLVAVVDTNIETLFHSFDNLLDNCMDAARAEDARVILYMRRCNDEYVREIKDINLQRERQLQYNKVHGLLSTTIHDSFLYVELSEEVKNMTDQQRKDYVSTLKERLMIEIKDLNFNEAAKIKAEIETIKEYFQ